MALVLTSEHGGRSTAYAALGGTIVVSRDGKELPSPQAGSAAPDHVDLAFDVTFASDKHLLEWLAEDGPHAEAELTVVNGRLATRYVLSGLMSKTLTITQSQDGAGQASLVLTAQHASIAEIVIN